MDNGFAMQERRAVQVMAERKLTFENTKKNKKTIQNSSTSA
jgi:hypothetical protein